MCFTGSQCILFSSGLLSSTLCCHRCRESFVYYRVKSLLLLGLVLTGTKQIITFWATKSVVKNVIHIWFNFSHLNAECIGSRVCSVGKHERYVLHVQLFATQQHCKNAESKKAYRNFFARRI